MHQARFRTAVALAGGTLLISGLAAAPATADPAAPYTVVASGLNNPRHLSFSSGGALYVAESGTGGAGPCIPGAEGGDVCYGATGSITKITQSRHGWTQSRVVSGLPSLAGQVADPETGAAPGGSALGPSDVDVRGHHFVASIGLGASPSFLAEGRATDPTTGAPATLPAGLGTLIEGSLRSHHRSEGWSVLADLAAHEAATNPIDNPDSNPASVARVGSHYLVADAGGNTILDVDRRGGVTTIAAFPDTMVQVPGAPEGTLMPMQFVPTSAIVGPHHEYYVSQLTGFPFPKGGSTIWRLDDAGHPTAYATGLTNVTDLAFAHDGSLYAVEISSEGLLNGPIGALVRIPKGGGTAETVVGGLFAPYGVALRGDNAYVTTGSILPGGGQVIKVSIR
jgi:hypothetical protein